MTERTRRQFLRDSMFTTAAMISAAPMIGAARAQNAGANDKLLCAVVGCKGRGGSHISAFSGRKDCEIAYIVDVDEKVGENCCNSIEKKTGKRPKWVKMARRSRQSLNVVRPRRRTTGMRCARLGHAGRQGCLHRKADQSRHPGSACAGGRGEEVRTDSPGVARSALEPGGPGRDVLADGGTAVNLAEAVLQTPQVDRVALRFPRRGLRSRAPAPYSSRPN